MVWNSNFVLLGWVCFILNFYVFGVFLSFWFLFLNFDKPVKNNLKESYFVSVL